MQLRYLLLIFVLLVTPYIWNFVKFTNCDFKSDFKCEVIHGVGVFIPPSAYITVWFDDDSVATAENNN
jgi:hypothetical protein